MTRPKYMVLRFDEDWSVLSRGTLATSDFFDPIKHIPLSDDGTIWASFGGQIRERVETWSHYNFGAPTTADDHETFLLSRFLFHGDLHLGPNLRLFAEGKSALSWERDLFDQRRTLDDDHLDLQNGFVELMLPLADDGDRAMLRAGRQELLFGAQRLVSPLDWVNARRTFDGFTGLLRLSDWSFTGFWTRPVIVEKYEFNEWSDDQSFFGLYAGGPTVLRDWGLNLDLYWLGLLRDTPTFNGLRDVPVSFNGTSGDEERHTVGGRLYGKPPGAAIDYDLEGAYQFGEVGDGDVDAWMIASQLGYTIGNCPAAPRLYAGFDYASGDRAPGGDVQTFNQLFPLGHAYFGYIDAIGRQNIIDVSTGLSFVPLKKLTVSIDGHLFWRAEDEDALYNAGGGVVRAGNLSDEREVGSEIDLLLKYQFTAHLTGMLGYSHFFAGPFIEQSGPSQDIDFGYLALQYTF